MSDPIQHAVEALERRIRRLETERRRWRGGAAVVAVAFLSLMFVGASRQAQVQDELRTHKLVVVDENNVPRIVIGQDPPDTQRRSPSCGIHINDKTGAERFGVGVTEDDNVNMGFDAPVGVGHVMRDRLALGVSPLGSPYVMLINNETKVPVRMVADHEGSGGGIEFLEYDRANSKVIVRRIGFAGEEKKEMAHKFTDK